MNTIIGGNVLIGLAAAPPLYFHYIIAELVSVENRFAILSIRKRKRA